ncbi:TonB-dependent receptor [Aquabacterium sp. OR-4]|uniref:TonB-dependent receptor n=1 Tax=Aquabacterium sp. OR-4 TaxID=2978127 RepID=UPI0028C73668|nr:TonB-dependent receptor [Aquabacterium sp. OR-4]MDT7835077.1 TonB-dependent receptor [Aquabacterium sp. OR-4]
MNTPTRHRDAGRRRLTLLALAGCTLAQAQGQANPPPADKVAEKPADKLADKLADRGRAADTPAVETLTITASRRAEPLKTAPVSATVLSGDDLARAGVAVLEQLQFATPSVAANNYGQGLNVTIRGIGKAETNTQTTTGVITYRDGVATSPGYFSSEPYYDIASVQILRGPQGTFGGQNATGGAVLVDSNDPVIQGGVHGYVLGQLGNYRDLAAQGAVNLPLGSELAARVAFNSQRRDSFWTVTGPHASHPGRLRSSSARLGLLWKPSPALSALLKTDIHHIDMGGYPADPVSATQDPFTIGANAEQMARDRFARTVLKLEYRFDDGSRLRAVTGYQTGNTAYAGDLDGTAFANNRFFDSTDERSHSQELNLISADGGDRTWVLGAYVNRQSFKVAPGNLVIGTPAGNPATEYSFHGDTPRRTQAVFGQLGQQLSPELKLVVEGRYSVTHHALNLDILQYGLPLSQRQTVDFKGFPGKAALNWTINDQHFVYGFVASANRPGGLNVPVGLGQASPFEAEKVLSAELGWKASWLGGRLNAQTSVFYNHYKNFQVTIGNPTLPVFGVEVNTPRPTRIHGLEQQIQARLGQGWSARMNLGWLRSALGQFYATDPRAPAVSRCDPLQGPASTSCIHLAGRQQTYAPEFTFNLGLERRMQVGDTVLTPRLLWAHVGPQWATLFADAARGDRLGSRSLLGAQIDLEQGEWMASLYGSNLTDERYVAAISSGLRFAGAPRQYGLRVTRFF